MKELEDLSWFPPVLRNFQTEFIGFVASRFNLYTVFIRYLHSLSLPVQTMTDLCSGSGEPAISIFRKSSCFSHLSLSDKYPGSFTYQEDKITYSPQQTDVLELEFQPGTCYTMFNAFHHFGDEDKVKIARKIRDSGSSALLTEILEPGIFCLLKVLFTTTIGSVVLTPFIRPFSFMRLLFTYLIPVNILAITFDGIVSVFKSRSVKHYKKLFTDDGDEIKIVRLRYGLTPLIVIQINIKQ